VRQDEPLRSSFRAVPVCALALLVGCGAEHDLAPAAAVDPAFLEQYAATYRFRHGRPTAIEVTRDGRSVLFLRSPARSFVGDLYEFDVAAGKERIFLSAAQLLGGAEEELSAEERARRERQRQAARGIVSYDLSDDGGRILVPLSGRLFVVERATGSIRELRSDAGYALDPRLSPDGSKVACVREGDLYVLDVASGVERRLTRSESTTVTNGLAEFVAQEEMGRHHGLWWSPDAERLVYQQTDTAGLETMYVFDPMHPERAPQSWPYPRPGKKNAVVRLGIVAVAGGDTTWITWDRERYPYLASVRWREGGPLTLVVQNRPQTEEAVLAVEPRTGATRVLLVERDDAWLNIDQDVPRWLPSGEGFLWTSERSGSWRLELRRATGELAYAITPPDFGYRALLDVDETGGAVVVAASPDPTERHLYRVPFLPEPGAPERMTEEPGVYDARFGEGHGIWVETSGTHDRYRVRRRDGTLRGELAVVGEDPPFEPNLELTRAGEFHAALVRPRHFQAGGRYPVIVYVYGGPRHQLVTANARRFLLQQWIADHGFVIVSLDGRGTPGRGRAWERAIEGNLVDVPLRDQVAGLRALGESYPELDPDRVGIYGWSFGGYMSAMAVARRPDVYRAGVAGAPVADWHDYDTHYTERYLGLPQENPEGYAASSVLTYAPELSRPLLIIHGTADDNVYFTHSIKLSNELFRAGRPHDFLPLSGFTHMVPDPLVTTRLHRGIVEFFIEHLR
jgi:dipeptidyl-peptidase-4